MVLLQVGCCFDVFEIILCDKFVVMFVILFKGIVLVLYYLDGEVLEESWDIMCWVWFEYDLDGWWSRVQMLENIVLFGINDGVFKWYLDWYKYLDCYVGEIMLCEVFCVEVVVCLFVLLEVQL